MVEELIELVESEGVGRSLEVYKRRNDDSWKKLDNDIKDTIDIFYYGDIEEEDCKRLVLDYLKCTERYMKELDAIVAEYNECARKVIAQRDEDSPWM